MKEAAINSAVAIPGPVSLADMDYLKLMDRTESKFVIPCKLIPVFLQGIDEQYRILEIDNHRIFTYNNIYFDTPEFLFYTQHVRGKLPRNKVRLRRYENSGLTYLEVKNRTNRGRVKKWRLDTGDLCNQLAEDHRSFIREKLQMMSLDLIPVLVNRFRRITLAAYGVEERVTIDFDLDWSSMNGDVFSCPHISVIEIKRASANQGSFFRGLLKEKMIHPSGFSKYCIGTAAMNLVLPHNAMKRNFLQIKKVENENAGCNDN